MVMAWKGCIGQIGECKHFVAAIRMCALSPGPALLHQLICLDMVTWTIPGHWEFKVSEVLFVCKWWIVQVAVPPM